MYLVIKSLASFLANIWWGVGVYPLQPRFRRPWFEEKITGFMIFILRQYKSDVCQHCQWPNIDEIRHKFCFYPILGRNNRVFVILIHTDVFLLGMCHQFYCFYPDAFEWWRITEFSEFTDVNLTLSWDFGLIFCLYVLIGGITLNKKLEITKENGACLNRKTIVPTFVKCG